MDTSHMVMISLLTAFWWGTMQDLCTNFIQQHGLNAEIWGWRGGGRALGSHQNLRSNHLKIK